VEIRGKVLLIILLKRAYLLSIKVLILSSFYPKPYDQISGIFAHLQVKHLLKEAVDIKVISSIPWAPKILWYKAKWKQYGLTQLTSNFDGIDVFYPPHLELPGNINFSWSGITLFAGVVRLVENIYKEFPFQIIHANTIVPDGFAALWLVRKFKVPCLCVSRGDLNVYPHYGKLSMLATRKVLRECDKLVTVSADLARVAKNLEPQVKSNISVVYNGCDLDHFQPVDEKEKCVLRKELGLPQKKLILFLLGSLEENKGIFELLEVYKYLRGRWKDKIYLLMIGTGKDETAFCRRIDDLNLRDSIHLTGYIPHKEIPQWVKAGDIMIFPTHYEGVPNAVLETMACAKPVVATAVGGIPEIIRDGETGFLVEKKDVNGIVKVVNHLIDDEDLRKRIGDSALEFLKTHASWPGNAKKMIEIYQEVINTYKKRLEDVGERRLSGFYI
jgi:glycosyltransferase involved in cell wall biosynthesis